jgi:hypothetical protein
MTEEGCKLINASLIKLYKPEPDGYNQILGLIARDLGQDSYSRLGIFDLKAKLGPYRPPSIGEEEWAQKMDIHVYFFSSFKYQTITLI